MRILEVILAPMLGGAESLVSGLTKEWRLQGHHVDIVALDPAPNEEAQEAASRLFDAPVTLPQTSRRTQSARAMRRITRLTSLIRLLKDSPEYDIIHCHSLLPNLYGRVAAVLAQSRAAKVITLHSVNLSREYGDLGIRAFERLLSGRTNAIVAVSAQAASEYANEFPFAKDRVVLIPNGIPFEITSKTEYSRRPNRFFASSRITPVKDILTMIKGFDRYSSVMDSNPTLQIAGPFVDAEYLEKVRTAIEQATHPTAIKLLGARTDIPQLLKSSDVFIHTSLRESQGIAVIEAAAAGLPIVSSDLPTIRETVGEVAMFFQASDVSALSSALHAITDEWQERQEASIHFARDVKCRYSMTSCAKQYIDLFKRVTAGHNEEAAHHLLLRDQDGFSSR